MSDVELLSIMAAIIDSGADVMAPPHILVERAYQILQEARDQDAMRAEGYTKEQMEASRERA